MVITGRHVNITPFRCYFVNTEGGMRLDWEASAAWSEVPVENLVESAPESPVMVRCWVGKQPHFDAESGRAGLFSWYQILNPQRDDFVWGFVPADSALDWELRGLMNYGWVILERENEVRATIRVVKPTSGFRDTEFEIVELITEEWVMP